MIVFRNSLRVPANFIQMAASAAAILIAAAAVDAAFAQTGRERVGAPIQLRPGTTGDQPSASDRPASGGTGAKRPARQRSLPAVPRIRGQGDVEIGKLKAFDPTSIGLLTDADGGLGMNMWSGSKLARIKRLMPHLPMGTTSPVMQSLARRLLLTVAAVPEDQDASPSLFALRIDRLAAGGLLAEIDDLLQQAPAATADQVLVKTRMEIMWLAGREAEACAIALNWVTRSDDPVWQKSAALCHAIAGEAAKVELYEQLLAEVGHQDEAFFQMIAALLGRDSKPPKTLPEPTALHLALLRANKWPLPESALETALPLVLRSVVDAPNVGLSLRLEATERAVATGAMTVEALLRLYAGVTFSEQALKQALDVAEQEPGARSNALLYRAARASRQPIERAKILAAVLDHAGRTDRYAVIAKANASALKTLSPVPGLDWFGTEAGRALLAAGDVDGALKWLALANNSETPAGRATAQALWPTLLVADPNGRVPFDAKRFIAWWRAQPPGEARTQRAGVFLSVLQALGYPVPFAAWDTLFDEIGLTTVRAPSPALVVGLKAAAGADRKGETVLLALASLGAEGPAQASPQTIALIIVALRRLGLDAEARAAGLEAMLAQKFVPAKSR